MIPPSATPKGSLRDANASTSSGLLFVCMAQCLGLPCLALPSVLALITTIMIPDIITTVEPLY